MVTQPAQQIPGVYHRKIGDIVVTAISDGYLDGSLDVMRNVDLETAHQILRDAFRPARRTSVNAFLIHSKGRIAIVDTGSGNYLLPTAGFVQRSLAAGQEIELSRPLIGLRHCAIVEPVRRFVLMHDELGVRKQGLTARHVGEAG